MSANHPHCTKRHPFAPADNHTHFFKKHPIDLVLYEKYCKFAKSLLNRTNNERCFLTRVTPYAGVWIETLYLCHASAARRSPPTRGCGLKLDNINFVLLNDRSPPTRGCGLKLAYYLLDKIHEESPPTRGCGLKRSIAQADYTAFGVTPYAGVWIETGPACRAVPSGHVTPYAGVWIETTTWASLPGCATRSPPTRGCGLKPLLQYYRSKLPKVTPYAGVWIETTPCMVLLPTLMSPPTRGCGLKQGIAPQLAHGSGHPLRGGVD